MSFWFTAISAVLGFVLSVGIAYGVMGSDVEKNTGEIKVLRAREITTTITVVNLRIAQGEILTQLDAVNDRLDTITRILERQYGDAPHRGRQREVDAE